MSEECDTRKLEDFFYRSLCPLVVGLFDRDKIGILIGIVGQNRYFDKYCGSLSKR